ncbi:O-antigen/teichoic acid export membrane protein [Variovorax sp. GrIS 2.14]
MTWKRPRLSPYAHSAAWSIVELLCSTGAQFVLTPLLLHRLGAEQFSVWVIAQTVLVGSATLSLGASTALMPVLAHARTRGDLSGIQEAIRLFIRRTLLMSAVLFATVSTTSGLGWAPATLSGWSRWNLWAIASTALLWAAVTELDNGLSSALKAQERFDTCALMEAAARTAQIALTFWLVVSDGSALVPIILAVVVTATKAVVKFAALRPNGLIQDPPIDIEKFERLSVANELKSNGLWIWLSVLSGLMFNAFDRWFVGAQLGSAVLVAYAACTQIAQMPHALVAAAGQTLGPWAAKRRDRLAQVDVRRNIRKVLVIATAAAALPSLLLLLVLEPLLSLWISTEFAVEHLAMARGMTLAFCLLSLNVPAYFLLLGLGRVRSSTLLVAVAGVVFVVGCLLLPPSLPGFVFMKGLFAALTISLVVLLLMLSRARSKW